TAVSGSFSSAVSLIASGPPTGATSTFSPTSITAPGFGSSLLTINNAATNTPVTYTDPDTTTGGSKTHTQNVSLTGTPEGASTTELITDGGFESATASGLSAPGWTATTTTSGNNVIVKSGAYPHAGTTYAQLGGSNSQTDSLTQTVSIASNATTASLSFWA